MSLFDKKGISLAAGFDYQAEQPLDSRFISSTKEELQKLIDGKAVYKGLVTYCLEDNILYIYNGTTFEKSSKKEEENYSDLISKINNLKTDLLGGADSDNDTLKKLADRITAEINRATTKENELNDALSKEISDREDAIKAEEKARTDADTTLQTQITELSETKANNTDFTSAKENLQKQIDTINSSSDVVDVVATKADLDKYNKASLTDKDIIKVLKDESNNNQTDYYRFNNTSFELIGGVGPYYTISEVDSKIDNLTSSLSSLSNSLDSINSTLTENIDTESARAKESENNILSTISSHISNVENPHKITANQIGAYTKQEADTKFASISALSSNIDALESTLSTINSQINDIQSTISTLDTKISSLNITFED